MGAAEREFHLRDNDFRTLVNLVKDRTGIQLADHKKNMVYSRLARRLRELGFSDFEQYIQFLTSPDGDKETGNFVNAITTNLTSFFRESHHFDILKELLRERMRNNKSSKQLRIWSAGCSSGQEPYSIAMTVMGAIPNHKQWDIKILATDIDTNMLDTGSRGVYPQDMLESIPANYRSQHTNPIEGEKRPSFQIKQDVRDLIYFKRLNLLERWPMRGSFDVIFCRNVVIYFDKDTQKTLFNRYADTMADHAHLFIGHSENLSGICDRFKLNKKTVYQKVA
jgi:chemotaxis protein methyltransferase CheR